MTELVLLYLGIWRQIERDTKTSLFNAILHRPNKPRWHRWIARPPPKGQVTGSTPVRGTRCASEAQAAMSI